MIARDYSRKFPIGIQSFSSLRGEKYLYVDKTTLVYDLVHSGKSYFLSRPRRFGKSLLLSTLESYFLGKKELFSGLEIEKLETEWKTYPVFHFDLNAEKYDDESQLFALLNDGLTKLEKIYGAEASETTLSLRFRGVIHRAALQTGLPTVVLIDEYDKPLLQSLNNPELHDKYKNMLKAFYGVLKSADTDLKFYLLTGVTKFSQVSVFSDLNQLRDISMLERYNAVCGMTWKEIEDNFRPELKKLSETKSMSNLEVSGKMKSMYDGYHFAPSSEGIFNPFSVLNCLANSLFESYWFNTGTPTFLVELLQKSDYDLRDIDGVELTADEFADYRAEANRPIPVIYQSGYLTIKKYDERFKTYKLGYPNEEVKYGFLRFVSQFYTRSESPEMPFFIGKFVKELEKGDVESFMTRLKSFFATIPYELGDDTERHYQTVFYLLFTLLGQYTDAEVRSAKGRADAVVKTNEIIYVFEFKLDGKAEDAIAQISAKGYLVPYASDGRRLVKVGANFSKAERNIERWIEG